MNLIELKTFLENNDSYFIKNNYLYLYLNEISKNVKNIKIKHKTQEHHCIPKCYFKLIGLNYKENKKYIDENNLIINVSYIDHIILHYYLCLFANKKLKYKLENAFFHLINRKYMYIEEFDLQAYLKEYTNLYEDYITSKKITTIKNEVICIELDKTFKNIAEANAFIGKSRYVQGIRNVCLGLQKSAYGYHWAYTKDKENVIKLKELYYNKEKQNYLSEIYCKELNMYFKSGSECITYFKEKLNLNISPYSCCKGLTKTCKGYHFCYSKDVLNYNFIPENDGRNARKGKEIICIETGKKYSSIGKAIKETGILGISAACRGIYPKAGGYHWCFIEDLNTFSIKEKTKKTDIKIKCLENNKEYKNYSTAAKDLNISRQGICAVINKRQKKHKGYTFIKIV